MHDHKSWAGVVRLGSIGDSLIASSVLPLLAKDYNVEVVCEAPHDVIYENNPHIAKLTALPQGHLNTVDDWQNWFRRRQLEGYAKFYHLSHTCEVGLAFVKVQTEYDHKPAFRRWRAGHSYLEYVHRVCEVPFEFAPRFYPTDEEKAKAQETKRRVGERVIGWVVSGSRIDKLWPYAPIAIARLIRDTNTPVMLLGGPGKDYELATQIAENVKRENGSTEGLAIAISQPVDKSWRKNDETGLTEVVDAPEPLWPIRRTLSQVISCDLVISPDTGLAWACSMEAMPKIVLLSHASDENITKHWRNTTTLHANTSRVPCWPCHRLYDSEDDCLAESGKKKDAVFAAACMSDIGVEAVMSAAHKALQPQPKSSALALVAAQ